ncbi:MAG: DUF2431 domain-containing protein [Alphaproteobacteria bacterium]|nr:DUF2431 domain-containing protein [Alphaproteobacteria bacterium]
MSYLTQNDLSKEDINRLIGSQAYRQSTHPDHNRLQTLVRDWFVKEYDKATPNTPWVNLGDCLLVGEGNLSFARSLTDKPKTGVTGMVASTYETGNAVSDEASKNAKHLKQKGIAVLYGIDARKLEQKLKGIKFDTIIFQFPNVGSRDPKYGHNPNHILLRGFLKSAASYLKPDGRILVTTVNSPHYEGAFQVTEAAEFAGYKQPVSYSFDPDDFTGYVHTNTNDDDSALDNHAKFITWEFRLS